MKVLFISSKPAYPKVDGGCVATANFIDCLLDAGFKVKYLTISTHKHPFELSAFPTHIVDSVAPDHIKVNTEIRPVEALKWLFKKGSYNLARFHSEHLNSSVKELLTKQEFQLVILDSLYSTSCLSTIREYFKGNVILRSHNVEHKIWQDLAKHCSNPIKRGYLKHLASDLKREEISISTKVDGILTISTLDNQTFKALGVETPMQYLPVAIKIPNESITYQNNHLFHLGSIDWQPNVDAINTVVEMMPKLRSELPDLRFYIAGKGSKERFGSDEQNGIESMGFVHNMKDFVESAGILISPITSGSGVSIKLLELMSLGTPIVTTTLGARGIDSTNNLLVANTEAELLDAVKLLVNSENKRAVLGANARSYIKLVHDPKLIGKQIVEFIERI